jgi:phage terminase large subunit
MEWPTNYIGELARRAELEKTIASNPVMLAGAKALYTASPVAFISDCVWVFEPRNANRGEPIRIPVVPFPRQRDFIEWMKLRFDTRTSAPVEKSRDSGATWMAAAFAVWCWLFIPGSAVGFGSRKEDLVDRAGDLATIFEKIRSIIRNLPPYLRPEGLRESEHFNHMRLINPENMAAITGEAGNNIGRGGRTSIYFIDEAAYIERPQMIEASLTANTDCRIDISSPQVGTLFNEWMARSPIKFVFDVSDAPWHTKEWIDGKRLELEGKGLSHIFRQEYLRDGTAGIAGQLIPGEWIEAAVDADIKLAAVGIRITPSGEKITALDVADGGRDRNALAQRYGSKIFEVKSRPDMLADEAGNWAYAEGAEFGSDRLRYDGIGVGAGAAAALRRRRDKQEIKTIEPFIASNGVVNPNMKYADTRKNEDMFANLKAQAWWMLRDRFLATFKAIQTGRVEDPDKLIVLSSEISELRELKSELAQVTYRPNENGKTLINKQPDGHPSPNRADAVMIAFAPRSAGVSVIGIF